MMAEDRKASRWVSTGCTHNGKCDMWNVNIVKVSAPLSFYQESGETGGAEVGN